MGLGRVSDPFAGIRKALYPVIIHLDYETRSKVDLPSCGAHRYGCDPSTEILMAGVSTDDSDEVFLWVNPKFRTADMIGENEPAEELLAKAGLIYAHNAPFEQAISWGCGQRMEWFGFGWTLDIWRCTAAMARKAGLPASLEKCAEALGLVQQKDPRGKQLIKFFSVPKPDGTFNEPKDFPEEWFDFGEYCRQDVRTEKAIHKALKVFELQGLPLETFQFDLRMNQLGIPVNVPALHHAQKIIDEVQTKVATEFVALTGLNPTQREKVRVLVGLDNMQAEVVEWAIKQTRVDAEACHGMGETRLELQHLRLNRILTLYQQVSYAAVKKIAAMLDWACPDGRMRGVFKYYGAGTGRWSSGGPQLQNAKKATSEMRSMTDAAYKAICMGASAGALDVLFGDPLEVIASSIRHFVHDANGPILDGDYNAIEGRIGCWIAGQNDILEDWRQGKDLYKRAAAFVFNEPESGIGKGAKRDFGKVVELACQFGLGLDGFIRTCGNFGIDCPPELAKRAVYEYYRPTHDKIVSYWYILDDQMREAISCPGVKVGRFVLRKIAGMVFMLMELPSGRSLSYPLPEINRREPTDEEKAEMKKGKQYPDKRFLEISYWGQLPMSTQWGRIKLHGSKAFENCLGEGTEVLTALRGWIPIESVSTTDSVWDGDEWVQHDGLVCQGEQPTINFAGIHLTPDHIVFEPTKESPAEFACLESALTLGHISWLNSLI